MYKREEGNGQRTTLFLTTGKLPTIRTYPRAFATATRTGNDN